MMLRRLLCGQRTKGCVAARDVFGRRWISATKAASKGEGNDLGTVPVNIMKEGVDPPVLPDDEYPEWLWEIHKPLPSLQDLQEKVEQVGFDGLLASERKRMMKLAHRKEMAESKASRVGKF
eukprot:g2406.t1